MKESSFKHELIAKSTQVPSRADVCSRSRVLPERNSVCVELGEAERVVAGIGVAVAERDRLAKYGGDGFGGARDEHAKVRAHALARAVLLRASRGHSAISPRYHFVQVLSSGSLLRCVAMLRYNLRLYSADYTIRDYTIRAPHHHVNPAL